MRERERNAEGIRGGLRAAAQFHLQLSELKKTVEKMSHRGVPGLLCSGKAAEGWSAASLAGAQMPGAVRQPLSSFTASESFYRQGCLQSITGPCTDVWGLGKPGRL